MTCSKRLGRWGLFPLAFLCLLATIARTTPARAAGDAVAAVVRPLLGEYCVGCHGADEPKARIDLSTLTDEASLGRRADVAADAIAQLRGYMMPPPSRKKQPTQAERERLVQELGAALDRLDARRPPFAGPANVRRLNRAEYRNAVRDLIGIDVELGTEFPADDTAFGFDNVADGLSLPPSLFEKYLAAAEEVLGKIATPNPRANGVDQATPGARLDGVPAGAADGDAVVLPLEKEVGITADAPQTEDYEVRVRASRDGPGPHPATLVLRVDGVDVKVWNVYAPPGRPAELAATVRLAVGPRRLALRHTWYTAQVDKEKPPADFRVRVESMAVRGPLPLVARRAVFCAEPGPGLAERDAAAEVIGRFAARAFRRPLAEGELGRMLALYDRARAAGRPHESATRVALASVLISPHFLFHVVRGDGAGRDEHGAYRLSDWELASRLSFFLWSAPPDEELRDLAAAGRLRADDVLQAQVRRMLGDPRAAALADNFGMQWLGVRRLESMTFDRELFPQFTDELRRAMAEEARLLFRTVVEEDRSVGDFIAADWTWMNEDLARVYGQRGVRGSHMRRVTLADPNRGGVLTMPAVLAVTSHPTRTSAVKRGKWVLDELLGAPPPPPPPDVPPLDASSSPAAHSEGDGAHPPTYRERMERHRADPRCFGCHVQMDALGLGLENFDPIGRWRRTESGGRAIDASGTLPNGTSFQDPAGLKRLLCGRQGEFYRCLTEKMFVYALGRGALREDRRELQRIAGRLGEDSRFSTLVTEIVLSYPFRHRQANDANAAGGSADVANRKE